MRNRHGNLAVRLQPVVSVATILTITQLRERTRLLKAELEALQTEAEPLEKSMIEALEAGAVLEPGSPLASVEYDARRIPKWKQEFIQVAGGQAAEAVIANTVPSITKRLVIS